MKKVIWVFLFFLIANFGIAQEKTHTVQPKETVWGISQQYGISQDKLKNANPFLKKRELQIGDILKIPEGAKIPEQPKNNDGKINTNVVIEDEVFIPKEDENFTYIQVKPKQTIYNLTKEYSISEEALKSLNPQLEQGLKAGDVIRIPKAVENKPSQEVVPDGMYLVKRGDTVFSLSNQFGVSSDEFYIANPLVQLEGLTVGSYINIPKKNNSKAVIQDGFIKHVVKQGETIYSITKLYKVSFTDLLKHNPELSEGLKTGMELKIPLAEGATIVQAPGKIKRIQDNEINIGLILPFHLKNSQGKDREKSISTDLLIGAKMALDSLATKGKKITLKVMDSESGSGLDYLLGTTDFSKFDAVVGPLFASSFQSFAEILSGSGIALISPLGNSDELKDLENVIIATPQDKAVADAVIEDIKTNYKGEAIYILTDNRDESLANYTSNKLKSELNGAEIILTKDASKLVQKSQSLDEKLEDGSIVKKEYFTPIITILVSDDNTLGTSYVEQLKTLDAENVTGYGIKFVSSYDIYNEGNKANIAALKNIGFTFGTLHLINVYGANERNTLEKFMEKYCLTPNEYQQLGFDILYDIVDRMNKSGDILNSLGSEQTRLSTKFKYEKEGKAFVNQSVRVVRLFVKPDESPEDVEDIKD